jgi:hypothetical protein
LPRYLAISDVVFNFVAYVPLGFLLVVAAGPRWPRGVVAIGAALATAGLSLTLEALQTWLPSRVPSILDLASNSLGGLTGAVLAWRGGQDVLLRLGKAYPRLVATVPHAEFGLMLLAVWMLQALSPELLIFATGDLRKSLGLVSVGDFSVQWMPVLEALVIVCNMLSVGLLLRTLLEGRWLPYLLVPLFFVLAMGVRTMAVAVTQSPRESLLWLSTGVQIGVVAGSLLLMLLLNLSGWLRLTLAALSLLAGTVLVNFVPPNPYALALSAAPSLTNLRGMIWLISGLWPFATLPYLLLLARRL